MNDLLLICILLIGILSIILLNKTLKNLGLKITFITFNTLSLILTFKYILVSTLNANASIITYSVMFTSLCLILEQKKKKEANKLITMGLIISVFSSIFLYIMSLYTQSLNDTIGINMNNVFINNYKVLIFYPISIFISQKVLIFIYTKIKNIYNNLFISTVTSYLLVGLIDSIMFTTLTYYNTLNNQTIIKILLSTYMLKIIVIVIYTIILTILNKDKKAIK